MSRGNEYSISMNANLDMSQAQKTYNEFVSSKSRQKLELPLDLKLDAIIPKLDSVLNNKIGRKIDETFDRINTKVQTVRKAIETVGEDNKTVKTFQNLTKVTETFKNDIGEVVGNRIKERCLEDKDIFRKYSLLSELQYLSSEKVLSKK